MGSPLSTKFHLAKRFPTSLPFRQMSYDHFTVYRKEIILLGLIVFDLIAAAPSRTFALCMNLFSIAGLHPTRRVMPKRDDDEEIQHSHSTLPLVSNHTSLGLVAMNRL